MKPAVGRPLLLALAGTALVALTALVQEKLTFEEPDPAVHPIMRQGGTEPRQTEPAEKTPQPAEAIPQPSSARGSGTRDARVPPVVGQTAFVFGRWERGGWADLMSEPHRESTRISQSLVGEQVKVLEQQEEWSRVRVQGPEGLSGWVESGQLTAGSERVRRFWAASIQLMVVEAPGVEVENELFLAFGARLPLSSRPEGGSLGILLPDGSEVLLPVGQVRGVAGKHEPRAVLKALQGFRRLPYRQGANTREGVDGAGLIYLYLRGLGLLAPRTVGELRRAGQAVPISQATAGDVIFFSTFYADRFQPVLLLDEGFTFLEASPAQGVDLGFMEQKRNSRIVEVRRYG